MSRSEMIDARIREALRLDALNADGNGGRWTPADPPDDDDYDDYDGDEWDAWEDYFGLFAKLL